MFVYYSSPEHRASTTDPLDQQPREQNPEHMGMEVGEGWIKINGGEKSVGRRVLTGEGARRTWWKQWVSDVREMLDLSIVPVSVL